MTDNGNSAPARLKGLVSVLVTVSLIQLAGVAADLAALITLPRQSLFLVVGLVAAILSALAFTMKSFAAAPSRLLVAAVAFLVSGTTVGIGLISRFDPPGPEPAERGSARIVNPTDGQELAKCMVAVTIEGSAAAGKALVAVTKQNNAAYYFEPQVETRGTDRWSATVQLGQAKPSKDESYEISVVEIDARWVGYLDGVLTGAATDWGVEDEVDATYWNTVELPPDTGAALHRINVHRTPVTDRTCPE